MLAKLVALLLLVLPVALFAQNPLLPADVDRIEEDLSFVRSLYPRLEGSASERELLAYIEKRLQSLSISYSRFGFQESDLTHSFSSCLQADIPGDLPDTLVLAVPLDNPPDAPPALDGSVNIALALAALEQMRMHRPPISVKVLFLGAEYGEGPAYPMGSRLFLRDFYPDHRVMLLYLNMRAIPSRLHVRSSGRGIETPYWLIERTTAALNKTDLFFLVRGNENQVFRTGLTRERTIIEPYLYAGYPAVSFAGEYGPLEPSARHNWLFSFGLYLGAFMDAFHGGIPETWDRHYLFFQARGFYFSISEQTYVILLIAVLASILLYGLAFTRRLRKYLRTLFRNLWALPLFFALCFGLLYASTWMLQGILALRRMPLLWTFLPLPFLAFKLAFALLIVFVLFRLFHRRVFPVRGSFYSAAALVFLLLDVVVLAVINISFTYYFLWAFTFALLFSVTPNKYLKLLFFLAAPYWIVKTVVELFLVPQLEFCRVLLLSPLAGNLLMAVILLPFVLMFIRLRMILPVFHRVPERTRHLVGYSMLSVVFLGLLAGFLVYWPYRAGRRQPVTVAYLVDQREAAGTLRIESPAPLGVLRVRQDGQTVGIDSSSRRYVLSTRQVPTLLQTRTSSVAFLDRKNVTVTLAPSGAPYRVKLVVSSPEEFVLFDCNFPYQMDRTGRRYEVLIGVNPPLPLPVQLTVPRGRTFTLAITLEYLNIPTSISVSGPGKVVKERTTYNAEMELKT